MQAGSDEQGETRRRAEAESWLTFLPRLFIVDITPTGHLPDHFAGRIRAGQLAAILRLTPLMMCANLLNMLVVDLLFWAPENLVFLSIWSLLTIAITTMGFRSWWRHRVSIYSEALPEQPRSTRGIRRMVINSFVMSFLWGLVPLTLFASVSEPERLFIAVLTTGMMGGGALALSTVPAAAIAYTVTLSVISMLSLLSTGDPLLAFVALVLLVYTWILCRSTIWKANMFVSRLIDQAELLKQNEVINLLLRDFEENATDWLWEFDEHGMVRHMSKRLAAMLGIPEERQHNIHYREVFRAEGDHDAEGTLRALLEIVKGRAPFRDQVICVTVAGRPCWWSVCGKPIFDDHGIFRGYRGVGMDITEAKQAEADIARMARFDSLTGLPNRSSFREALERSDRAFARADGLAVLYLDLDQFKAVNDTMGHAMGDRLLVEVSDRLRGTIASSEMVARLGGDEFAVLIRDDARDYKIFRLCERIIRAVSRPYDFDGKSVQIGTSIGIAISRDDNNDPEELMKQADLALYAAKRDGRGRFCLYGPEIDAEVRNRRQLAADLRDALRGNKLSLHYQPIIESADCRLIGFEALLRWTHPERGPVSPAEFIPVAEQCGLMDEIGTFVIRRACMEASAWPRDLKVAVNLSPIQFHNAQFLNIILAAIGNSGIAPDRLELEITETALLSENSATENALNQLRSLGVRIALDDFGTGYASLAYLRSFPFDKIKIDQSFVREALERPDCAAIVEMVVSLAASLGMTSTAEGVETYEQMDWLREKGCTEMQGYLFSRPRPVEDLQELFSEGPHPFSQVA